MTQAMMEALLASKVSNGILQRSRTRDHWRAHGAPDVVIKRWTVEQLVEAGLMSYTVYVDQGKRFPVEASVSVRVKD